MNAALRDRNRRLRRETIDQYGGGCVCCGEREIAFLVIDHIGGGGNDERRAWYGTHLAGGARTYRKLKAAGWPPGYQVLCANCNMAKEREGGCPHGVKRTDQNGFD